MCFLDSLERNQLMELKVAERENPYYAKEERRYIPWLLLVFLLFIVLLIILSAFQKSSKNTMLTEKTVPKQLLSKKINEANNEQNAKVGQKDGQQNYSQHNFIGKIKTKMDLNLHSTPERSNNVIGAVLTGTVLSVKGKMGKWYQVVTPENKEGYITSNTKYIEVLEMKE